MVAHERHITVTDAGSITISGLPIAPGQRVRVTVAVEDAARGPLLERFRSFFQALQGMPHIQRLSDDEIANEIAAHRRSPAA